nr:TMV resistance protein N-like [Quercus suber]
MEELVNLLGMGLNDVRFIGIWGMGGLGKTTLARVFYDRFRHRFEGSSFLANVREECGKLGLVHLQKQLLSDILIERNIDFSDVQWGSNVIEKRLCYKSVLIVLDDVDQLDQLEALAGKRGWFGRGSRVIITTRDQHLLTKHDVARAEIYKAKELNSDEALQLFSQKAFKKDHPLEGYVELSKKAICYAQGLPLALNVLGPFLKQRSPDAWESALDRLEETPQKKVLDTLRISFDGLEETEKKMFLDIACFFKGEDKDRVTNILRTPRYKPSIDIDVLVEKSLITIFRGNLWMHDLLQELGRQIVHSESPEQPGSRSRLWLKDDVLHVLKNNIGSKNIRGIMLHSPQPVKVQLHTGAFKKMKNLKFLMVKNVHICEPLEFLPHSLIFLKWPNYPFHLPFEYFPEQFVAIEMPHSCIKLPKLIKQERQLENLVYVNLKGCKFIKKLPILRVPNLKKLNLSSCGNLVKFRKLQAPNLEDLDLSYCKNLVKLPKLRAPNLEYLGLSSCENLVEINECFGSLEKLRTWDLHGCRKLQILPSQLMLKSLVTFLLIDCPRLEKLPNFNPEMECLEILNLSGSGIREVPSSIKNLTKLHELSLIDCKNLWDLPDSIYKLQQLWRLETPTAKLRPTCNSFDGSFGYGFMNLKELDFVGREAINELDLLMKPDYFPALEFINLSKTNIVTIPESISRFPKLKSLHITDCKLLREIQGLPQSIRLVEAENCMLLDTQSPSGLLNQVIEIIGILPSRVCGRARSNKLMDPQLTNYFPSEIEGAESEDGDISMDLQFTNYFPSETESAESEDGDISMEGVESEDGDISMEGAESEDGDISMDPQFTECEDGDILMDPQFSNNFPSEIGGIEYEDGGIDRAITFWGTEMPKWFNHQSVDDSIFFFVGRKFPKLVICFDPGQEFVSVFLSISINGYEKLDNYFQFLYRFGGNNLQLFSPTQRSLQRQLNKSNPTDQNLVKVSITDESFDICNYIKRWGVHVECTCPPQESAIPNLPLLTARYDDDYDVVDYLRELPFYGSDDKEEYQSPLVHDDDVVDYMHELPFYGSDDKEEYQSLVHDDDVDVDVDYLRELPFYGSDDKEEYQSPLVHDDDVDVDYLLSSGT